MNYKSFRIADTVFAVDYSADFSDFDVIASLYLNNPVYKPDLPAESPIKVIITIDPDIKDEPVADHYAPIWGHKLPSGYKVYLHDQNGLISHLITTSQGWKHIRISSSTPQKLPFYGSAGEVIFRTVVLFRQGIVAHAAGIDYAGKGIMFSAPSGIGKSTQADLWRKYRGAKVLNGDRPALRLAEGGVHLYGTPWCGTSRESINGKVPLAAIVMLEQAAENVMRRLTIQEAVQWLAPRCYLPYFDADLMSLALDNIGGVIERVPVYLLQCRPEYEAVELVEKCLQL